MVNPCSKPSTDSDRKTKTYLHSGTIWGHYLTSLRSLTVGTADIWGLLVRCTTYPPVSHHLTYSKCISTYKIRGEKNRLSDTARKQAVSTTVLDPSQESVSYSLLPTTPKHPSTEQQESVQSRADTHRLTVNLLDILLNERSLTHENVLYIPSVSSSRAAHTSVHR